MEDRLLGILIAITGAMLLALGISMHRGDWLMEYGLLLRVPVAIGCFGVALTCFTPQLISPPTRWEWPNYLLLGTGIGAAYGCAFTILNVWPITRPVSGQAVKAGIASIGLSASFFFSLAQFWYSNLYLPNQVGPAVSIQSELVATPSSVLNKQGLDSYAASIKVKNISKAKVMVVSSVYGVRGLALSKSDGSEAETHLVHGAVRRSSSGRLVESKRVRGYASLAASTIFDVGKVAEDNSWLEPSEEFATVIQVAAPKPDRFDVIQLFVQLVVANSNKFHPHGRLSYGPKLVERPENTFAQTYIASERPLRDLSLLRRALFGQRGLRVVRVLQAKPSTPLDLIDESPVPSVVACVDRLGLRTLFASHHRPSENQVCHLNRSQKRLGSFYGLVQARSMYELTPVAP
jgi:hypothetical protein